jgi:tryptophan synthase alpha chain
LSESSQRLAERWRTVKADSRAALIPYLPAGYPTPQDFVAALAASAAAGADLIEVGVPFSDPLADGPVVQRATQAALAQGVSVRRTLDLIAEAKPPVPVVVMTYVNPVLTYGVDRFLQDAERAGVSGVLLTDLPAGADPDLEDRVAAGPLAFIRLIAPTTPAERIARVVRRASGFLYLISRLGVTGARERMPVGLPEYVKRVRAASDLPVAVGFGIGTGAQARDAARLADGVVVGSALVDVLGREGVPGVTRLVRELAAGVRGEAA